MALLLKKCTTAEDVKALETLTSKLKKGIERAANTHFFQAEFPHHTRMMILQKQNGTSEVLTSKQSEEALRSHFKDIASSRSTRDGYIDKRSWGSNTTLRMLAKILNRNIYSVEASNGIEKAEFSLFTPAEGVHEGETFTTVKERIYRPGEVAPWMINLQNECVNKTKEEGLPIVIIFRSNHYNWLKFAPNATRIPVLTKEASEQAEPEVEVDMDCREDFPMGEPDDDIGSNQQETELPAPAQSEAEQQEHREIEQHGGTRKAELRTFSTAGVNGLVPAHRQAMRELNLDDNTEVLQWCLQYDITKEVLQAWKTEMLAKDSQETSTPSPSTPLQTSGSQWDEEQGSEEDNKVETDPQHPMPQARKGVGRFSGEADNPASTRLQTKLLRSEWNQNINEWERHTDEPYPTMPATTQKWQVAIKAAPQILRAMVKQHSSPEFLLSDLTEAHMDIWTKRERLECLLHSLEHFARQQQETNQETADWIRACIYEFDMQASDDLEVLNLYPPELWTKLKKLGYGKMQLLRLCRKVEAKSLTRMILLATIYTAEIQTILQVEEQHVPTTTMGKLSLLFEVLEKKPKMHALLCREDSTGLWVQIQADFAKIDSTDFLDQDYTVGSNSPEY